MKICYMSQTRLILALVAAGLIGSAGTLLVPGVHVRAAVPETAVAAQSTTPAGPIGAPDFSRIVERYSPAVVNISVSGVRQADDDSELDPAAQRRAPPGFDPSDPLFEFFRRIQDPNGAMPDQPPTPIRGQGSGFIISPDGLILTNAHVVRDAKDVTVKLTDRREFRATVLGSDPNTDVAVIRIDAKDLPTAPIGSAREMKVGEWVLAIGSPFGFENSVTAGVVSAKRRSLPEHSIVRFIQTDVAVNPGSSGGPLFNTRGEVVGINSQIFSRSGGYQGLSFAIPIDLASRIKDQIVATGKASHARLGVAVQEVNQTLADAFKLDGPEGALVSSIDPGSPADKAGLKSGDVIRKVDGRAIVAAGDLSSVIGTSKPGEQVMLEVIRQGNVEWLTVQLGDGSERSATTSKADDAGQG